MIGPLQPTLAADTCCGNFPMGRTKGNDSIRLILADPASSFLYVAAAGQRTLWYTCRFHVVSELPTIQESLTVSPFVGTNPTDESITSGLQVIRPEPSAGVIQSTTLVKCSHDYQPIWLIRLRIIAL
jgi:DNA-binding beta-propeller fold protein YncE